MASLYLKIRRNLQCFLSAGDGNLFGNVGLGDCFGSLCAKNRQPVLVMAARYIIAAHEFGALVLFFATSEFGTEVLIAVPNFGPTDCWLIQVDSVQ